MGPADLFSLALEQAFVRAYIETGPIQAIFWSQSLKVSARIYLDHAATTPILPAARYAVAEGMTRWANPSSPHAEGRAARAALEQARARIADALGWRHHVIFTSGASEAAAIGLTRQAQARPALIGATEHKAVLRQRPDATILPVGADGLIDPAAFGALLRDRREAIVAIQHVNSETGVIQPIASMIEAVDVAGGVLFVDCAQSAGKLPLPDGDLLAVSAHKLGGPPGIGALLVRDLSILAPMALAQEQGYRAGTENLPAILGFAAALEAATRAPDALAEWVEEQIRWRVLLDNAVENIGGERIGGHQLLGAPKSPAIGSYRMPGVSAEAQLIRFDMAGFAVSAGSACSSGAMHRSHVLAAMGIEDEAAGEVIRVSFGRDTRWDEVDRFAMAWQALARERGLRAA